MGRGEGAVARGESRHLVPGDCRNDTDGDYIDLLESPARPDQDIVVLSIHGYTWVVPFVVEDGNTLFLKTAYPSRKFHRRYGGRDAE